MLRLDDGSLLEVPLTGRCNMGCTTPLPSQQVLEECAHGLLAALSAQMALELLPPLALLPAAVASLGIGVTLIRHISIFRKLLIGHRLCNLCATKCGEQLFPPLLPAQQLWLQAKRPRCQALRACSLPFKSSLDASLGAYGQALMTLT